MVIAAVGESWRSSCTPRRLRVPSGAAVFRFFNTVLFELVWPTSARQPTSLSSFVVLTRLVDDDATC